MTDVKCADCAEYRNEWCEKVIDSPHPDMLRDCEHFHEKDMDLIKVIRCKDCRHWRERGLCGIWDHYISNGDFFCGCAERKGNGADG